MKAILSILAICLLNALAVAGQVYFLSPNGNDHNSGAIEAPWRSLQYAVRNTQPGDTIFLRQGVFHEERIWMKPENGGANGKFKVIAAYPGESAICEFTLTINGEYVLVKGLNFILPHGMQVVEWAGPGSSRHVHLIDNHFSGPQPRYGAIEFAGSYGIIAENTIEITDGGDSKDHGIYLQAGTNNIIRDNLIKGAYGYGIHVFDQRKSQDAPDYNRVLKDIFIDGNTVIGSRGRSGIILDRGEDARIENVIIRRNLLIGNNHVGLLIREADGDIRVHNNTFVNNGRQALNIGDGNTRLAPFRVEVVNNIFYDSPNSNCISHCDWFDRYHVEASRGVNSLMLRHNMYWPPMISNRGAYDPDSLIANPGFRNIGKGDFQLTGGSPAIDSGQDVGLPFSGAAPDIGAIEYNNDGNMGEQTDPENLRFRLEQNYPNPFNPETTIHFEIYQPSLVRLTIYDINGKEVQTLLTGEFSPGVYSVKWNSNEQSEATMPSGTYFYRLEVTKPDRLYGISEVKKMILLR